MAAFSHDGSKTVDFGVWQGPSIFVAAGVVRHVEDDKKCENAARGREMPFLSVHRLRVTPVRAHISDTGQRLQ
jgi:hypothetical protein